MRRATVRDFTVYVIHVFKSPKSLFSFFSIVLDAAWRSTHFELHSGLFENIWRTRMFCLLHFIRTRHQRLLETMDNRPRHQFNVHQSNHKRKLSLIWVKLITCFHDSWIYEPTNFFHKIFFILFISKIEVFYWNQKCRYNCLANKKRHYAAI